VVTWDIEIQTNPEDCIDGWDGARRGECGVSCVALFDTASGRMHIYDHHDLTECVEHLNTADLLVGFNTLEFDTPALESVVGSSILPDQYDILHEIWKANGKRFKGYRLGDICERMGLGSKNGEGARATDLFKQKRFGRLFDYCMNDVHLTRMLAQFINDHGHILSPDGLPLVMPRPDVEV
jgi:DEAD/DEAH box helicase domain-containing protein